MSNFTNPVKAAFGRYLQAFHAQLIADTPAMVEFCARDFARCAVWAPGRMVDQAMEMLESWRKNDTSGQARPTPYLPVIIAAMAKDFTPAPPDFGRPAADPVDVMIPGDPKQRVLRMRTVVAEIRAQVAICAAEEPTARSIAMQLALWCQSLENRRFYAQFPLVGTSQPWPVVFELPDLMAVATPADQKNLTVLAADFNLRATVPLLTFPKPESPEGDGQGTGTYEDPDGYLVVRQADIASWPDIDPDPERIPPGVEPVFTQVGSLDGSE